MAFSFEDFGHAQSSQFRLAGKGLSSMESDPPSSGLVALSAEAFDPPRDS